MALGGGVTSLSVEILTQSACVIAASALAIAARLATANPPDFPMTELTIEHWPVAS